MPLTLTPVGPNNISPGPAAYPAATYPGTSVLPLTPAVSA